MFSTTTTKVRPGVPYDISRIYELLTPRPKVKRQLQEDALYSIINSWLISVFVGVASRCAKPSLYQVTSQLAALRLG
jgi:hypothetical protein